MADNMKGLKRTCYCGEVSVKENTGTGCEVTVGGYVQKTRDLGNLILSPNFKRCCGGDV